MLPKTKQSEKVPKSRSQILAILAEQCGRIHGFGVRDLYLFGSAARDTMDDQSDIDMVVEFAHTTYRDYKDFKSFLESILHRHVDLLTAAAVKGRLKQEIQKDAIHVQTL